MMFLQAPPAEPNRIDKKKVWEALQPLLKTNSDKVSGSVPHTIA